MVAQKPNLDKHVTITAEYWAQFKTFVIKETRNTAEYKPGEELKELDWAELSNRPTYTMIAKPRT